MRLIDADNIRDCAKYIKINEHFEPYIMVDDLVKLLDEQPTAYDIDKVIKELEKVKNKDTEIALDETQKERCFWYAQGMNRAIKIVKGYGVDDMCEWKSAQINNEWKPSCEPNSTYNVFGVAWFKRCPYCGKKIKVVE